MEPWVARALARWPNVPALYGWLRLDRRGRWLIRGEVISRPQIIDTINANYAADAQGRWYFQNGPQRGYIALDYAPLILRTDGAGRLYTHTGLAVTAPAAAFMDEHGALLLTCEHGPGVLEDASLAWALERLHSAGKPTDETRLAAALAQPSGMRTAMQLRIGATALPVTRMDVAAMPAHLGFVREPQESPD
ncbi:MAG TPA: DUF2946 family protein [Stenotrophobium sp.]|jgi:hypothetical protein|nr:DUF2946 family protein [Stenotrophobium sp.]